MSCSLIINKLYLLSFPISSQLACNFCTDPMLSAATMHMEELKLFSWRRQLLTSSQYLTVATLSSLLSPLIILVATQKVRSLKELVRRSTLGERCRLEGAFAHAHLFSSLTLIFLISFNSLKVSCLANSKGEMSNNVIFSTPPSTVGNIDSSISLSTFLFSSFPQTENS